MYHRAFFHYGFEHIIRTVTGLLIDAGKVGFGVGLVENAHEQTARVAAMRADEIMRRERELLVESKSLMGRLPFDAFDLLIVDWMGKNISGTGMDTNIIGRMMQILEPEPEKPAIVRIFVRDLTDDSDGNATGVGLADFTTTRPCGKDGPARDIYEWHHRDGTAEVENAFLLRHRPGGYRGRIEHSWTNPTRRIKSSAN